MGDSSLEALYESPKKSPEASKYCEIIKGCIGRKNDRNLIYTQTLITRIDDGCSFRDAEKSAEFARQKVLSLLEKD
ncbi:hypothetical protein J4226_04725 [Candidatus Pacearchaeota archaeon]|nr:hypothetical protein [Candidatus Pacearchaeota archaeon]